MGVITAIVVDAETGEPLAAVVNDSVAGGQPRMLGAYRHEHQSFSFDGVEEVIAGMAAGSGLGRFFGSVAVGVCVEAFSKLFLR